MRTDRVRWVLAALAATCLAACQQPDVGQRCSLDVKLAGAPVACSASENLAGEFLETGVFACENLTCICSPPQATSRYQNAYCSKPCVSNADCFQSETGLVCRSVVLDSDFLNSLPDAVKQKYLGDVQHSRYCATPQ